MKEENNFFLNKIKNRKQIFNTRNQNLKTELFTKRGLRY